MNLFRYRHFKEDIIIWAVRWYCRYGISYRDLEEMLEELEKPKTINTDGHFGYTGAIPMLKVTGDLPRDVEHRKVKYLNNKIESDHGKLKRLIKPTLGFKSLKTARATIAGFGLMRMFKKGQLKGVCNVSEEVRLVTRSLLAF